MFITWICRFGLPELKVLHAGVGETHAGRALPVGWSSKTGFPVLHFRFGKPGRSLFQAYFVSISIVNISLSAIITAS